MIGNVLPENNGLFSCLIADVKDNLFKRAVKISVGVVSFSLIALIAIVETLVHSLFIAITFLFTLPLVFHSKTRGFQKAIMGPFTRCFSSSARVVAQSIKNIFKRVKPPTLEPVIEPKIDVEPSPYLPNIPSKMTRTKIIARRILKGIALTFGSLALTYYLVPRIYGVFIDTAWIYKGSKSNSTELANCIVIHEGKWGDRFLDSFGPLRCKNAFGKYFLASDKCLFLKKQFRSILTSVHPDKFQPKVLADKAFSIVDKVKGTLTWIHRC